MKHLLTLVTLLLWLPAQAQMMELKLSLPNLDVGPYHKPYVAVWVETPERQPVTTITLWVGEQEWYKDLRQWWRKIGRNQPMLDAFTGATRRPGHYTLAWDGKDAQGNPLPHGSYLLNVEAVREEGGRSYKRIPFELGSKGVLTIEAQAEFGEVQITLNKE